MSWTILLSGEKDCEICNPVYSRALMVPRSSSSVAPGAVLTGLISKI